MRVLATSPSLKNPFQTQKSQLISCVTKNPRLPAMGVKCGIQLKTRNRHGWNQSGLAGMSFKVRNTMHFPRTLQRTCIGQAVVILHGDLACCPFKRHMLCKRHAVNSRAAPTALFSIIATIIATRACSGICVHITLHKLCAFLWTLNHQYLPILVVPRGSTYLASRPLGC